MNETLQQIVDLILQWGPSVVSIITMICTVIVAIKKLGISSDKNYKETQQLRNQMDSICHENAELKRELRRVIRRINRVRDDEE